MPYDDLRSIKSSENRKYIVTHGKWTIAGSYKDANQAENALLKIGNKFVISKGKPSCEKEMIRFWPEFEGRFKYLGFKGSVIVKIKSEREFRSAITFKHKPSGIIYVIPGKISNIFDVEDETVKLINAPKNVEVLGKYECVTNGVLHEGIKEVTEKPKNIHQNTCELQTYREHLIIDNKTENGTARISDNPCSFIGKTNNGSKIIKGENYDYHLSKIPFTKFSSNNINKSSAQKKAEASSQAKSTFIHNMSHDLRTPLTGLLTPMALS